MSAQAASAQTSGGQTSGMPADAVPVLALEGVTKRFGGFVATKDVSISFPSGGVYGIIGPNGAGKTTLFNLLSGFLEPSEGILRHRGQDITGLPPAAIARRGVVRSFQITSIFANLTLAENILLPLKRREGGAMRFLGRTGWRERFRAEIDAILEEVGIPPEWRERPASGLAYGQKRALELGISLAARPDVLLLDEPTAGMTGPDIVRVTGLIERLAVGRTVVVVEHNLGVIADLAREIVVLQQGQVLTQGPYETVRRDPRVIEAYLGSKARRLDA